MKNTILSLVLGLFLMPGFGLNFMSGSSVDWGHTDAAENPAVTADTATPTSVKPHVAATTLPPAVAKTRVTSLDSSYSSDQPGN
jgi:hypothetical protein